VRQLWPRGEDGAAGETEGDRDERLWAAAAACPDPMAAQAQLRTLYPEGAGGDGA
jgi:hypothetical protein